MPKRVSIKGRGADLFFGEESPPTPPEAVEPELLAVPPEEQVATSVQAKPDKANEEPMPVAEATSSTNRQARSRSKSSASGPTTSSSTAENIDVIESIRQIVKMPGREVSYVRLTPEEKARLGDVIYTYKRQGQKTTETEINRIALNYLLNDYFEHGEQSVLARVLAALAA